MCATMRKSLIGWRRRAASPAYLSLLPEREAFARKMRNLVDYERTGVPVVRGGKAFYRWNAGLMNQ
jgi:prolyl oligopeptidase